MAAKHPEAMQDPQKNAAVQHHFNESQRLGLQRGSREYLEFFDRAFGYQQQQGSVIRLSPEEREVAKLSGITEIEYAAGKRDLRDQGRLEIAVSG